VLILHAGCGNQPLPQSSLFEGGKEVRLDIDPNNAPDIVASIDNLGDIGPFDVVWCSHCLEHLHFYEAEQAMREFYRVLKPGGVCVIMVPDLEGIEPTEDMVYYVDGAGPITGLDMYYGHRGYSSTNPYMMHKCGFVSQTLRGMFSRAGFTHISEKRDCWNLIGSGVRL
jgi:predicted SAM-dependent methyltransferase